jgi:hypothetical protein
VAQEPSSSPSAENQPDADSGQAAPSPYELTDSPTTELPLASNAHRAMTEHLADQLDDEAVLAEAVRVALERHQRRKPESTSPAIILVWLFWLMGNWGIALYLDGTHRALRWMAFGCLTGLLIVWPAVRLSLDIGGASPLGRFQRFRPGVSTLLVDWTAMVAILMIVVGVLSFPAGWEPIQVVYLAGTYVTWSLLAGAIIFIGSRSLRGHARTWAMLACLALMFAEPVLQAVLALVTQGASPTWTAWASPVEAVWKMTAPAEEWQPDPWLPRIAAAGVGAVVVWLVGLIFARGPRWSPSIIDTTDTVDES